MNGIASFKMLIQPLECIVIFTGGEQRGLHNHDLELPSPARQHSLDAKVDLDHISSGDQHFFKINPNDTVCNNVQSFNTTTNHPTHPPTQWLPWILRMSRPGRPLTKKSIQLQVINPSIVFLKYNDETPDQCGCQPAKNLDLNSISYMATSDKDGQAGGGRQEL